MGSITWGTYSITLLIGSVQGLLLAGLLLGARANAASNRALAGFIVVVVLLVTPYTLGFAGFFDRFRWLNFAPFYWELALGPLAWLYVRQLGRRRLPRRWALHLVPAGLQGAYYLCVWIAVPTALKDAYNDAFHVHRVLPLFAAARCISYVVYAAATLRAFRGYQAWLADHSGQREEYRLRWLRLLLWPIGSILLLDAAVSAIDLLVQRPTYRDEFPLYVLFAALVWVLGLEGWRHATRRYPKMDEAAGAGAAVAPAPLDAALPERRRVHDWPALAARWIEQIERGGWYREPDLSLALVAQRLGTNTNYLSRALNEGAAQSFSDCVNRLRVRAAEAALAGDDSILDIAFAVGFSSKASFNRVFKAETGMTPSAFRAVLRAKRVIS